MTVFLILILLYTLTYAAVSCRLPTVWSHC